MEDLETLKVIKEKEESINREISTLKAEKEKEFQQMVSTFGLRLKENEEQLNLEGARELEETRKKAQAKANGLISDSRVKAGKLKLNISDRELEKLASDALNKYLEGM